MPHAPAPKLPAVSEARRLAALSSFDILDTEKESAYEDIVRIASYVCRAPISVVNLIDADRQWFKAEVGLGVRETPLDTSICAHAILEHDLLVIPDTTQDPRFAANPLVTGEPGLRFYAGALLKTADGLPLGTVCVLDTQPRTLDDDQIDTLRRLARQVMAQMELRRMLRQSQRRGDHLSRLLATAGHDLKAPLRSALYAMSKVRSGVSGEHAARLDDARTDLLSADQQLSRLLASTHADIAGGDAELGPVVLHEVFDALSSTWTRAAQRKRVALTIGRTGAIVRGHPLLLETVLGNALSNAVKYTPGGGAVTMLARSGDGKITIDIQDNGCGIPAEKVEELFSAFRQADPQAEGLGLGLWLIRQSAAAMHAEVEIHPGATGGTIFRLSLDAA
ncbi:MULTISPECIES: GAF domain-containing sensor histidine kinase [Rhodanobacteraceae]|uniref:sensor histidine kinase n=1 Tax=Rhodanobacteraceae TaxID=1775411 RepID=UPI0008909EE4|nr:MULTISPECIES: GAF domain-containing sensor histidine kinase [Rhodanobacteraceae]SDG01009.1 Signal transduction histidine kinase [Dyella sp. 333MFSha]SKB31083.1 Signal transduction histidine kinase [Luteibacter sp. 22Crub2.1]